MWKWEMDSILYSKSPHVPPKDIFQAVCNELGRYYLEKELQYVKSKRELRWKGNNLWCKFGFWSSHHNRKGEWVNLEIVTSLFAINTSDMERNGVLSFGFKPQNFNVYGIDLKMFDKIISYIDSTIMNVKELDTKAGLEKFLLTMENAILCEKNPNNLQYLKSFGIDK